MGIRKHRAGPKRLQVKSFSIRKSRDNNDSFTGQSQTI